MRSPGWFSQRYPELSDLVGLAETLGARVHRNTPGIESAVVVQVAAPGVSLIFLPAGLSALGEAWQLGHELAHLVLHPDGYISRWTYNRQEAQAKRWAARALIPEAAVRRHRNASLDAFIAALSAHYEDIPMWDCPQRRLAAEIATIRLGAVEEVG